MFEMNKMNKIEWEDFLGGENPNIPLENTHDIMMKKLFN